MKWSKVSRAVTAPPMQREEIDVLRELADETRASASAVTNADTRRRLLTLADDLDGKIAFIMRQRANGGTKP